MVFGLLGFQSQTSACSVGVLNADFNAPSTRKWRPPLLELRSFERS
jgi:hypothetical protein